MRRPGWFTAWTPACLIALALAGCGDKAAPGERGAAPAGSGAKATKEKAAGQKSPGQTATKKAAGQAVDTSDPVYKETATAIAAAGACPSEGRFADDLAKCPAFKRFVLGARRDFDAYRPGRAVSVPPVRARLAAAVAHLRAEPELARAAARRILELGLKRLRYAPSPEDGQYTVALEARLAELKGEGPTVTLERLDLIRLIGIFPQDSSAAALGAEVGHAEAQVRRAALNALARCAPKACKVNAEQVLAWHKAWPDATSHDGVMLLAGKLKLDALVDWCAAEGQAGGLGEGCRLGLKRLDRPEGFTLLAANATRLIEQDAGPDGPLDPGTLGGAVGDLLPYARRPGAGPRLLPILDRALDHLHARPGEYAVVAGQLRLLRGLKDVATLALAHHDKLEKLGWGKSEDPAKAKAWHTLRRSIKGLGAGEKIGLSSDPHGHGGHDHGGHDHGGHDHGHEPGGHDHGGHDHGDHQH